MYLIFLKLIRKQKSSLLPPYAKKILVFIFFLFHMYPARTGPAIRYQDIRTSGPSSYSIGQQSYPSAQGSYAAGQQRYPSSQRSYLKSYSTTKGSYLTGQQRYPFNYGSYAAGGVSYPTVHGSYTPRQEIHPSPFGSYSGQLGHHPTLHGSYAAHGSHTTADQNGHFRAGTAATQSHLASLSQPYSPQLRQQVH
jgi:hypothetical protein